MFCPALKKNKTIEKIGVRAFAHRGLHSKALNIPENSLAAFKKACEHGYAIELDVHISKDGTPIVMHDGTVDRTTEGTGKLYLMTDAEISKLHLKGTDQKIPLLKDVLQLINGKVPLLIELKSDGSDRKTLCTECFKLLDNYDGDFIIESFDPRILRIVKKLRPNVARGQLSTGKGVSPKILNFLLRHLLLNFISRPHFIAYDSRYIKKTIEPNICKKIFGCFVFVWTITKKSDFEEYMNKGMPCIFENFEP